jgi:hypothetical protein
MPPSFETTTASHFSSRDVARVTSGVIAAVAIVGALAGCDRKPSSPPTPSAAVSATGPTAASGGAPSSSYPAGIRAAPSGDKVQPRSTHDGPGEGATAIGGLSAGQNAAPPPQGGTAAPTGGDAGTGAVKPGS